MSKKRDELEAEANDLSSRLDKLMTETMDYSRDELRDSKGANETGDKAMERIKQIIGPEHSLDDFLKIVPVRNAVYAGAFSLDSDNGPLELGSMQWLWITGAAAGAGKVVARKLHRRMMLSVGRAYHIRDVGGQAVHAGRRTTYRPSFLRREGRRLSRRGGALELAGGGHMASIRRRATIGRWAGRASSALGAISIASGIASLVIGKIRERKYIHELEDEIQELKVAVVDTFSDRAVFFYDKLQMGSLTHGLDKMDIKLETMQEDVADGQYPTYEDKKTRILSILSSTREALFKDIDDNQAKTKSALSEIDKGAKKDGDPCWDATNKNWDPCWNTVNYHHDVTLTKIRVLCSNIVEAIQCVSRDEGDGRMHEGLIYGGATRLKDAPEGSQWWSDEILLAPDQYITKALWKKSHVDGSDSKRTAIWDLRISTNHGPLPVLGWGSREQYVNPGFSVDYDADFLKFEEDGFVLPDKAIIIVNNTPMDSSYTAIELIDSAVTMEREDKTNEPDDVVVKNTDFIESLKFVIEMNEAAP